MYDVITKIYYSKMYHTMYGTLMLPAAGLAELTFNVSSNTRIGHFGDILPSQSFGLVLKN